MANLVSPILLEAVPVKALAKAGAAALVLHAIYKKYMERRDAYTDAYKQAKKRCFGIMDPSARNNCIHKTMSSFYRSMSQLELDHVRELMKAHASPKKIKVHQKRARFYAELSKVIANPGTPVKDAHKIVQDRLGFTI